VKRPNEILRKASAYWPDLDPVEIATLEWVDWFNNRRLLGPIGSVSAFLILAATAVTVIDQPMSPPERQARVALIALMVVAAIGLANVSSIFRLGRERVAIALGVSAELVLWCGSFMSMTSGGAAFSFGQRLFFFVGVPFIIAAAVYLPLLPKLDRWPPQAS
jgi:peptidoglycan/LPS O-acetylase OafA/YrhL